MIDVANYVALEHLRDGRPVKIRALRPDDRANFLGAIDRVSTDSIYRRFFSVRRYFSEQQVAFFVDVDFVNHVALVATVQEQGRDAIVGGGRYVVMEPAAAEVAFTVVDQYQGQVIGGTLLRHLAGIARDAGLKELRAEVLPDNAPMLKVFKSSGLTLHTRREANVIHVKLGLA